MVLVYACNITCDLLKAGRALQMGCASTGGCNGIDQNWAAAGQRTKPSALTQLWPEISVLSQ